MKKIEEYFENNDANNRLIQKGLRELDLDSLYDLCAALGDKKELLTRNLSERVADEVENYLSVHETKIPEHAKKRAYFRFSRIMLAIERDRCPSPKDFLLEKLDLESLDGIRDSILTLQYYTLSANLEKLDELIEHIEEPLVRKQIELILSGLDPLRAEDRLIRLQRRKQEYEERRAEMLKDGILSILSEESLETLFGKLDV